MTSNGARLCLAAPLTFGTLPLALPPVNVPGKFMAFPGEDYHKLLGHLATEIYHYRYPVEHGVDVLQSVVRSGAPEALKVGVCLGLVGVNEWSCPRGYCWLA